MSIIYTLKNQLQVDNKVERVGNSTNFPKSGKILYTNTITSHKPRLGMGSFFWGKTLGGLREYMVFS